jgi:hypothetical protein
MSPISSAFPLLRARAHDRFREGHQRARQLRGTQLRFDLGDDGKQVEEQEHEREHHAPLGQSECRTGQTAEGAHARTSHPVERESDEADAAMHDHEDRNEGDGGDRRRR